MRRISPEGVKADERERLPAALRAFLVLLAGLTAACGLVEAYCQRVLHLDYPYKWPLLPRWDPFRDFYLFTERFRFFHSSAFFGAHGETFLYPAPLAPVYEVFFHFAQPTHVFTRAMLLAFALAAGAFCRSLWRRGLRVGWAALFVGVTVACGYPLAFVFEQGNVEWVVWLFVAGGIILFLRGRTYWAAVAFGVAGSMKLFPLVYLGLLLARRQYRQMAVALAAFALATLTGLWLLCPDLPVAWHGTQAGLETFRQRYMLGLMEVGFDHSLFALGKALARPVAGDAGVVRALPWALGLYLPVATVAGTAVYFVRIRKLPVLNQVITLTVASVLLPPVSYEYTLIQLYVVLALLAFVALEQPGERVAGLLPALVLLAILLAPVTELIYHGRTYAGQVKCLALLGLFSVGLARPMLSGWDGEQRLRAGRC